ncbi:OmpA family protein [Adlercreutzia caecimuris]|uniref:OmpA family protein n=1 Tax=Adlercreutzia caecimuris TaxID=671266 RepID=UPI0024959F6A|nr:OmpA family protein [Adlercreutzia caecimuris]
MKKNRLARLGAGVGAIALSLLVAGCAAEGPADGSLPATGLPDGSVEARDIAIVYANRANSSGDLSVAAPYIEAAARGECYLVGVSADGKPQAFAGAFELNEENGRRRDAEVQKNIESVIGLNWSAQTEESDLFSALCAANSRLAGGNPDVPNLLIVIDSGISTAGPVNFTEEATREALLEPEALIATLRESGDLAKFENIDEVVWFGLGDTSGAQSDSEVAPNEGTKAALKIFYRTLFEAAGVELGDDQEVFRAGSGFAPAEGLPGVTVVDMPRIPLDENGNPVRLGDNVEFDELKSDGAIKFDYDSDALADESAAREALKDHINQLIDFPTLKVVVNGYTDTAGDASYNLDLSQRRANTVKALMVDAGVPESQITAVGMGEDATYETDEQNRRVEIVLG